MASKNGDIAADVAVAMIGKVKQSNARRTVVSETDWNNVASDVDLDNNDGKQTQPRESNRTWMLWSGETVGCATEAIQCGIVSAVVVAHSGKV